MSGSGRGNLDRSLRLYHLYLDCHPLRMSLMSGFPEKPDPFLLLGPLELPSVDLPLAPDGQAYPHLIGGISIWSSLLPSPLGVFVCPQLVGHLEHGLPPAAPI
jgi:hypothetical protein